METVSLKGKDLRFCKGCLTCQKTQRCVIADDAPAMVQKMYEADVLVFATPIYYYELSGQLKTLLDRDEPAVHHRLPLPRRLPSDFGSRGRGADVLRVP